MNEQRRSEIQWKGKFTCVKWSVIMMVICSRVGLCVHKDKEIDMEEEVEW